MHFEFRKEPNENNMTLDTFCLRSTILPDLRCTGDLCARIAVQKINQIWHGDWHQWPIDNMYNTVEYPIIAIHDQ
jgi:hypothetical protein